MGLLKKLQQREVDRQADARRAQQRQEWLHSDRRAKLILRVAPSTITAAVGGDEGPQEIAGRRASLVIYRRRQVAGWALATHTTSGGGTAYQPEEWLAYTTVYLTTDGAVVVGGYRDTRQIPRCRKWKPDGSLPGQSDVVRALEEIAGVVGVDLSVDRLRP